MRRRINNFTNSAQSRAGPFSRKSFRNTERTAIRRQFRIDGCSYAAREYINSAPLAGINVVSTGGLARRATSFRKRRARARARGEGGIENVT
jgi:hypothetical protein